MQKLEDIIDKVDKLHDDQDVGDIALDMDLEIENKLCIPVN